MGLPDCPTEQRWRLYLSGSASAEDSEAMDAHLSDCPTCLGLLDQLSRPPAQLLFTAEPATAELPRLPGYTLLREIGAGGMGVVFLAEQHKPKRMVAVKTIRGGRLTVAHRQSRFQVEADAIAQLQHPNIVQVFEVGTFDGGPYFAMEHLEGGSLAEAKNVPAAPRAAADLVRRLAEAIQHAHDRGVIHRDLKPGNVLFSRDGFPKVCDFGLARLADGPTDLTQDGPVGTPSYMAPEQAGGGGQITVRTDVYALGAILYELLTGQPPFRGESRQEVMNQVREREPTAPRQVRRQAPRDLETIVLKCLEKDPKRRYDSAGEMAADLKRFLDGELIRARPASALERAAKWVRRHPAWAAGILFLLLGPSVVAGVAAWYGAQLQQKTNQLARVNADLEKKNNEIRLTNDRAVESRTHAIHAADALVEMLVGIKPIAGTRSQTLVRILNRARTEYNDLLQQDPTTPEVKAGKARMLNQFADVYLVMNDTGAALQSAQEARDLFQELVNQAADDADGRQGLARSQENIGVVLQERGDLAGALTAFRASQALRETLLGQKPDDLERLTDLSTSRGRIGDVLAKQGDYDGRKAEYDAMAKLRQKTVELYPNSAAGRRNHGVSVEKQGDDLFDSNPAEARRRYEEAKGVYAKLLTEDETNADYRKCLVRVTTSLGQAWAQQRDKDEAKDQDRDVREARTCFEEAAGFADQYRRLDPANLEWQREYWRCQVEINRLPISPGEDPIQAVKRLQEQLHQQELVKHLVEQAHDADQENAHCSDDLAAACVEAAEVHTKLAGANVDRTAHLQKAGEFLDSALKLQTELTAHDPTNEDWAWNLAEFQERRGGVWRDLEVQDRRRACFAEAWRLRFAQSERMIGLHPNDGFWRANLLERCQSLATALRQCDLAADATTAARVQSGIHLLRQYGSRNALNPDEEKALQDLETLAHDLPAALSVDAVRRKDWPEKKP